MKILTRTFQAKKAHDPEKRKALNLDALTSEYMPSHRYLIREPFPNHPTQEHISHTFRTKAEAEEWLSGKL